MPTPTDTPTLTPIPVLDKVRRVGSGDSEPSPVIEGHIVNMEGDISLSLPLHIRTTDQTEFTTDFHFDVTSDPPLEWTVAFIPGSTINSAQHGVELTVAARVPLSATGFYTLSIQAEAKAAGGVSVITAEPFEQAVIVCVPATLAMTQRLWPDTGRAYYLAGDAVCVYERAACSNKFGPSAGFMASYTVWVEQESRIMIEHPQDDPETFVRLAGNTELIRQVRASEYDCFR